MRSLSSHRCEAMGVSGTYVIPSLVFRATRGICVKSMRTFGEEGAGEGEGSRNHSLTLQSIANYMTV